ncbi:MAG: hypothetical protein WC686_05010, partial [Candidatus Shapirobacteria bacterium]
GFDLGIQGGWNGAAKQQRVKMGADFWASQNPVSNEGGGGSGAGAEEGVLDRASMVAPVVGEARVEATRKESVFGRLKNWVRQKMEAGRERREERERRGVDRHAGNLLSRRWVLGRLGLSAAGLGVAAIAGNEAVKFVQKQEAALEAQKRAEAAQAQLEMDRAAQKQAAEEARKKAEAEARERSQKADSTRRSGYARDQMRKDMAKEAEERRIKDEQGKKDSMEKRLWEGVSSEERGEIDRAGERIVEAYKQYVFNIGGVEVTPVFGENKEDYGKDTLAGKKLISLGVTEKAKYQATVFLGAKGSPEEMQAQIRKIIAEKGTPICSNVAEAKQWLTDNGIMIDCCGMVANFVELVMGRDGYAKVIGENKMNVAPGDFEGLVERGTAVSLSDVSVKNLRPGDIITLRNPGENKVCHTLMVGSFEEEDGNWILNLIESTDVAYGKTTEDLRGIHSVKVIITNPEEGLAKQRIETEIDTEVFTEGMAEQQKDLFLQAINADGTSYKYRFDFRHNKDAYRVTRIPSMFGFQQTR